jgi:hypothetical protein
MELQNFNKIAKKMFSSRCLSDQLSLLRKKVTVWSFFKPMYRRVTATEFICETQLSFTKQLPIFFYYLNFVKENIHQEDLRNIFNLLRRWEDAY